MNPIKSPHQLLLEEAGASLDPSPGLVNTPQQMLMQQANVLPHLAPGGKIVANLAKFLEDAKIPQRLYHGTTASEENGAKALSQLKQSKEGALGAGVYMTPKTDFASFYANEPGGYVMPVHTNIKNPLELHTTTGGVDPMKMALMQLGVPETKADQIIEKAYDTRGYIGKEVMSRAQKQGYDGLAQYHDGNLNEVVSYNPMSIKSATGNTGEYNPYDPRLSKKAGGYIDNLSPADMQAAMVVNGNTPQHFATGGQSIAGLYNQGVANKAAYDKELADKARAEEATYQNQPPVWQAIPNQDTYSIKARNAFAKQLANLTGNERWSEDTTNDIFGGGADEPLTRSNAIPKAVKTAVQFANPVSTITDIMDAPKEVASQANEGNYLGAGITAGFTGLAALPYFKPAKKLISPVLKKIK